MTLENIIGVEDAAEILNLSPGTVKNKCAAGELYAKKIGKTWILDKTNLKEQSKMNKLDYTMMAGRRYKLPEGYYAIETRAGDQVYNANHTNVTRYIEAGPDHTRNDDFFISYDNIRERLVPID